MKSKVKYVIWNEVTTRTNLFSCGGCVALCVLFDFLKSLDAEVYLSHEIEQSISGLKEYQDKDFFNNIKSPNLDEFIAIYPEVTIGNPLNCKKVVRWLLHSPDEIIQGSSQFYEPSDTLIAMETWVKEMSEEKGFKVADKLLKILHIDFDIFKNENQQRNGICHIIKKGIATNPEGLKGVDITPFCNDPKALAKIFNKSTTFYSYDDKTYLSVLAALCGCDSIVVNTESHSSDKYFDARADFWKYGIAYGINNLEHARNTKHLLKEELIKEKQKCLSSVKEFVHDTQPL